MQNGRNDRYIQVQIRFSQKKKVDKLAFDNDLEIRIIAAAIMDCVLCDEKKLQEIIEKLKMRK